MVKLQAAIAEGKFPKLVGLTTAQLQALLTNAEQTAKEAQPTLPSGAPSHGKPTQESGTLPLAFTATQGHGLAKDVGRGAMIDVENDGCEKEDDEEEEHEDEESNEEEEVTAATLRHSFLSCPHAFPHSKIFAQMTKGMIRRGSVSTAIPLRLNI